MKDDSELVDLALSGDREAFAELYDRYYATLFDFLIRIGRSESEAADLARETFRQAIEGLIGLNTTVRFKTWLLGIARRTVLSRLENDARLQFLPPPDLDAKPLRFDAIDPTRLAGGADLREAEVFAPYVWQAARTLDHDRYSILDLSLRQELDSSDLAEVLSGSRNNAYVIVSRTKGALQDAVAAVVVYREGRRHCPELNALLLDSTDEDVTAADLRLVDQHASSCLTCGEIRRRVPLPFDVFAAFAMVRADDEAKASTFSELMQTYPYRGGAQALVRAPAPIAITAAGGGAMAEVNEVPEDFAGDFVPIKALALFGAVALGLFLLAMASAGGGGNQPAVIRPASPTAVAALLAATPTRIAQSLTPTPVATALVEQVAQEAPTSTPLPAVATSPAQPTAEATATSAPIVVPSATVCAPELRSNPVSLIIQPSASIANLVVTGNTCGDSMEFSVTTTQTWLKAQPESGRLDPGGLEAIVLIVDRSILGQTDGKATLVIQSGGSSLSIPVEVRAQVAVATPTLKPISTP